MANELLTNKEVDSLWDGLTENGCGKGRYDIARLIESAVLAKLQGDGPVAWMHDHDGRVDTIHRSVKDVWLKVGQKYSAQFMREIVPCKVEHYTIPLYTRPAPVQGVVKSDQEIHDIAWSIGGVDGGGYYFDTPELLKFIKQVTTQEAGR
jgi:hypothetical protein